MKNFIIGFAIFLILLSFHVFQTDINLYLRELDKLKFACDEASFSASLYYNTELFNNGIKVFNEADGIQAINDTLKEYLLLDNNFFPLDKSYWKENIVYTVYFFNDNGICNIYDNGIFRKTLTEFTGYPYMYVDEMTGYNNLITEAKIIITVNAGKGNFRLSYLQKDKSIRSSGYEYEI